MKKTLSIVIFALLFAAGPLMAQKQLYFGVGGTGLTSYITSVNNYGLRFMDYKQTSFGGKGNVYIGFDFSKHAGLKIEIGYGKLGQDLTKDYNVTPDSVFDRSIKLNYLQIPVLFKFRSGGEVARLYLLVGPQFNLLMSGKQTYTLNGSPFTTKSLTNLAGTSFIVGAEDIKERYSSLDIMARFDLGVEISLSKSLLLNAGLSLGYGLLDINATDWRMNNHDGNYNASHTIYGGINVSLNYVLPIGSK